MINSVGERIKQVRVSFHLSQRDFCKKINIPQIRLSEIEKGKTNPSFSALQSIADVFSVSLDWLLLNKGQMTYAQPLKEYDISPEELQILVDFRKLSETNKHKIQGMIELKLIEEKEGRKSSHSPVTGNADDIA